MNTGLLAMLSILPIASVAVFLVWLRWPAARAMPVAYLVCAILALWVWQVPAAVVAAASVNGIVVAASLIFIIFGAIALLNSLQESGGLYANLATPTFDGLMIGTNAAPMGTRSTPRPGSPA